MPDKQTANREPERVHFTRTHWTVVLSARDADSPERDQALAALCQTYWPPIYAFIRQRGYSVADAQDLTQDFFARLLEKDYLQHLTHQDGKFRSFLLAGVNHLLLNERDKRLAQKRGGACTHIPLEDIQSLEAQLAETHSDPDEALVFDRIWARTVLQRARQRLSETYRSRGKSELFEELKQYAPGSDQAPHNAVVAARLGMTEEALRAAVHRMRVKLSQLIREEVSLTVTRPADVDPEIRHLLNVVSNM